MIQTIVFLFTIFIHLNALADTRVFGVRLPDNGLYCYSTSFCGGENAQYEDCRFKDSGRMAFQREDSGKISFRKSYHAGGYWGGGHVTHGYDAVEALSEDVPGAYLYHYSDHINMSEAVLTFRPVAGQPDTYSVYRWHWYYGYICR